MSTASTIAAKMNNGKIGIIYCNFDGYIAGVGNILFNHYQDQSKIEKLINLGNVSSIDKNIVDVVAYGRKKNKKRQDAIFSGSYSQALRKFGKRFQEYDYFWDGEKWLVNGEELEQAIKQ